MSTIPYICHFYWDNPVTLTFMNLLSILSFNYYNKGWSLMLWLPEYRSNSCTWLSSCNKHSIYDHKSIIFNYIKTIPNVTIQYIDFNKIGFSNTVSEVHKSFYFRYYVMFTYGGIWSELDILYIKPLSDTLLNTITKCVSKDNITYYHTGFLSGTKNSKFYKYLLDSCDSNYNSCIYQTLGTDLLNSLPNVINLLDEEGFCVLSNIYFIPYQWYDVDKLYLPVNSNEIFPFKETIGIHWFNGNYISKQYIINTLQKLYNKSFQNICLMDNYVYQYLDDLYSIYTPIKNNTNISNTNNTNLLCKPYLFYCFDKDTINMLITSLNIGYNSVGTLGMVTDMYFHTTNNYQLNSTYSKGVPYLQEYHNIYTNYSFENKFIVIYNNSYCPNTLKNSYIEVTHLFDQFKDNNIQIFKILELGSSYTDIVFIDEPMSSTKYYNDINEQYKKVLDDSQFKTISNSILYSKGSYNIFPKNMEICLGIPNNNLFILNPINFASLLLTYDRTLSYKFINTKPYIVVWQEIMYMGDEGNPYVIGYPEHTDKQFIISFFKNSKLNIVGNIISFKTLNSLNIYHNLYFSIGGYSKHNYIDKVITNYEDKPIDVLIYGTLHPSYSYRHSLINNLKKSSSLNIVVKGNIWNKVLDEHLEKTKIVLHIPSHANCNHIPWAKINYLQTKKVFYIVEECNECTSMDLSHIIPTYSRGDIQDLVNKINMYINDKNLMDLYIERNHNFVTTSCNLDNIVVEILSLL